MARKLCCSLLLLWLSLEAVFVRTAPLTASLTKSIPQPSTSLNLVQMNGLLFMHANGFFYKTPPTGISFSMLFSAPITVDESSTTMLLGIPEMHFLVYVGYRGSVAVLDVNNPILPIVAQTKLLYYGIYQGIYAYQMVRKPGTPFIYIGNLIGSTIQKVDYMSLSAAVRIVSGPSKGYESLSIGNSLELAAVSANGVSIDLFNLATDAYSKSVSFFPAWAEYIIRSVESYPRVKSRNCYLAPATNQRAYYFCSESGYIEKSFSITVQNPELSFYVPNTNFMLITYYYTMQFLDLEKDDSASRTLTLSISSVYYSIEFIPMNGKTYLGVSVYMGLTTLLIDTTTELCHYSCSACSRSFEETGCIGCKTGFELNSGKCASVTSDSEFFTMPSLISSSCLSTEYATVDRECRSCSLDCLECNDATGFCRKCSSSKAVSTQGTCAASCASNEYEELQGSQRVCKKCHPSCSSCIGPNIDQCNSCDPTKPLTLLPSPIGRCKDNCGSPGFDPYYSAIQSRCISCGRSCEECGFQGLMYACRKCRAGMWIQAGECVPGCPVGMLANSATGHCEYCEEKGLDTIYYNGACIKAADCPPGNTYANLACLPPAGAGGSTSPPIDQNPAFPGRPTDTDSSAETGTSSGPEANSTTWKKTDKESDKISTGGLILFLGLAACACFILAAVYCLTRKARARSTTGQAGQQAAGEEGVNLRRGSTIPILLVNLPTAASNLIKKLNPFGGEKKQVATGTWQIYNPSNAKTKKITKSDQFASSPLSGKPPQSDRSEEPNSNEPRDSLKLSGPGQIPVFSEGTFIAGTFRPKKFRLAQND